MKKKFQLGLMIGGMLLFWGIGITSVYAQTSQFDITVNKNTTNADPLSMRTIKDADGDDYFYVKPTYFSSTGTINVRSVYLNTPSIRSPYYNLSSGGVNVTRSFYYGSNVPDGVYYYLEGDYSSGTSNTMRVKGNYTP